MEISERLKAARQSAGMTQDQVAEKIMVSRVTVSHWENGKSLPDIVSLISLSDLYSISLDELVKGDSKMNPPVYQMVFTNLSIAVKKPLHHHFSRFFFIITVESGCQIPISRQTAILAIGLTQQKRRRDEHCSSALAEQASFAGANDPNAGIWQPCWICLRQIVRLWRTGRAMLVPTAALKRFGLSWVLHSVVRLSKTDNQNGYCSPRVPRTVGRTVK